MKLKKIITTSFMAAALTATAAVNKTDFLQNKQSI